MSALVWTRDRAGEYVAGLQDGSAYRVEKGKGGWHVYHRTYERDVNQQSFTTVQYVGGNYTTLNEAKEAVDRHATRRNSPEWYFTEAHRKLHDAIKLVAYGANAARAQSAEPVIQEAAGQFFTDSRELSKFLVELIKLSQAVQ